MKEQLEQKIQQRINSLHRYTTAMEHGDLDTMTIILEAAQYDPILERMIVEVNEVYQIADRTVVHPDDVVAAQEMLQTTFAEQASVVPLQDAHPLEMMNHSE